MPPLQYAQSLSNGDPATRPRPRSARLSLAQAERLCLLLVALLLWAVPAYAQTFPPLTGRVVDNANLLSPAQESALTAKLQSLEQASSRQLVVATMPDLQGYDIRDYGYQLGRAWGIGQREANNGVILLVAPNERKVAIEVGYGLEPIVTDALSTIIIQNEILPRFRQNDYPGGIEAGVNALIQQLQAPPEQAEQRALAAAQQAQARQSRGGGESGSIFPLIFWGFVVLFVILPMLRRGGRGRRYRRRGGGFPVILWGPGLGGGGGFGGGGFGGGGFGGGGGSFGGGGASGGW